MKIVTSTTHHIHLETSEFFRFTEQYVERDQEIEVHRIDVTVSGSVRAVGPKVKVNGDLSSQSGSAEIEVGDLPIALLTKIVNHFIEGA